MADDSTTIDVAEILAIDAAIAQSSDAAPYGVTRNGFVPKPFARLLAEKLALAQSLFGGEVDLTSASAIRKLLEVTALEEARTWAALASMYDNSFAVSATGEALSRLGEELGLPRPHLAASGRVTLRLAGELPGGRTELTISRGARMLSPGGHHVATTEMVLLSVVSPERSVGVEAFYPGPEHNLDPTSAAPDGSFPQKIDRWNYEDSALADLADAEAEAGAPLVTIDHTAPLTDGEKFWSDARYRQLLLQAPRSLWTVDAIRLAVSLVPGVRQVQVRDGFGGLDIHQSLFGNFNFIERVFGTERDLGSPYYFTVLIAPTPAAIWEGPDGLRIAVESAIEDLRPISIFPSVEKADEIGVGIQADLVVRGLPLPTGPRDVVNDSEAAGALKERLLNRVQRYVDNLEFGEPVRSSEALWAMMNEPGVADVRDLSLLRYPPGFDAVDLSAMPAAISPEALECGQNLDLRVNQIPVFVDDDSGLTII